MHKLITMFNYLTRCGQC